MVSAHEVDDGRESITVPPIVDQHSWETALAELRSREKAATRELEAIRSTTQPLVGLRRTNDTLQSILRGARTARGALGG